MTTAAPKVSVVMIFLDAERFIAEAIESVFAQTYRGWELLLVDDGSTDGSTRIARQVAAENPDRVRYLEHPGHANRGMSASRNLGIASGRGELIALLDADDVYLPEKLNHQVRALEACPEADMVYGVTEYWHSWTGEPADLGRDRPRSRGLPSGTMLAPGAMLRPFFGGRANTPCTCGVLMRRSAIEAVGGFEDRFEGMYEDQVFFLKMFVHCSILVDDRCLDRYRQHRGSHSSTELAKGRWSRGPGLSESRRRFLEWAESFLAEAAVGDPTLARRVRRELLPYRYPGLRPLWRLLTLGRRRR